jgi:hypothetical protein
MDPLNSKMWQLELLKETTEELVKNQQDRAFLEER